MGNRASVMSYPIAKAFFSYQPNQVFQPFMHPYNCLIFLPCISFLDITTQGCSNDWKEYKISSYYFVTRLMTWGESRANCLGCGGDMVSILDSSEVEFIKQQTNTDALRNYGFWIGLFREKKTSDPKEGWIWSDGNNFTKLQQWRPGEPNNFDKNENCAELEESISKMWNDIDCANLRASICKTKQGRPNF